MIGSTKKLLADSFCTLIEKKPLAKITVEDIASSCGTSRQTFYNNFKDKYDLIGWIYAYDHQDALALLSSGKSWRESLYQSYLVFWEHKRFYETVAQEMGQNSFLDFLWGFCNDFYEESIVMRYGKEEVTDDLRFSIQFNDYGAVNMFRAWLAGRVKLTPKEMSDSLVNSMPAKMKRYFD